MTDKVELFESLLSASLQSENVCYSGGAKGSDRFFGIWAAEKGHDVLHFGFDEHKYKGHDNLLNVPVPDVLLQSRTIKDSLIKANLKLKRKVPSWGYVYKLLARNSYQILHTERVYCMVEEVNKDTVSGGTGWAVQMYIDSCPEPELYVYNIHTDKCYQYEVKQKKFVEVLHVPEPHGKWTGIGTRDCVIQHLKKFSSRFIKE